MGALVSIVMTSWYGWISAVLACMFTWQATVCWCAERFYLTGRNVWERPTP
jgi:hypothetical protein